VRDCTKALCYESIIAEGNVQNIKCTQIVRFEFSPLLETVTSAMFGGDGIARFFMLLSQRSIHISLFKTPLFVLFALRFVIFTLGIAQS